MHKAMIIAAGLALTTVPALAQDTGMGSGGDHPSYVQDRSDDGGQPRWRHDWSRGDRPEWRYGGRNWRSLPDDEEEQTEPNEGRVR